MPDGGPHVDTGFAEADDGLRIFWRAAGPIGAPAMVCCNGVGVSTFFWKYLVEHYAERYRVVLWDYRGHGRSDTPADFATADLGIVRHAYDMEAVLNAAGVGDALFLGHSMGCQVIFEFNRRWPARVRGLVPILGSAGRTLETFYDNPASPRYFRLAARVIDRLGDRVHRIVRPILESPISWTFARTFALVDPYYASADDMLPYMRHLASMDMRLFIRTVLATNEHDAWDTLATITVPTLVVAAENDVFTPMWLSRKMAASIPGAEFLVLAEATHAAIIEQPETIYRRLDRFLAERHVFSR